MEWIKHLRAKTQGLCYHPLLHLRQESANSLQGQMAAVFGFADPAVSVTTSHSAFVSPKRAQCSDKPKHIPTS